MPLFILFMSILPLPFDLLCFIALMNQCVPIARNCLFPPLLNWSCQIVQSYCINNFIVLMVNHKGLKLKQKTSIAVQGLKLPQEKLTSRPRKMFPSSSFFALHNVYTKRSFRVLELNGMKLGRAQATLSTTGKQSF